MKKKANILLCRICLRSDRKLITIDGTLLDFHEDLCEYSRYTLKQLYCMECVYVLKKTYSFKNKCMKALEVFENWKKSNHLNNPVDDLCTLLPSSLAPLELTEHSACIYYEYNEEIENNEEVEKSIKSEARQNSHSIIQLEIGFDSYIKELTKTENFHIETTHENNEDNHIKIIDVKTENDMTITDNVFMTKPEESHRNLITTFEQEHNYTQKVSNNFLIETSEYFMESKDNLIELNDNIFESNDSVSDTNDNVTETNDTVTETKDNLIETYDNQTETNDTVTETYDKLTETNDNVTEIKDYLTETYDNLTETNDHVTETNDNETEIEDYLTETYDNITETNDHVTETIDNVTETYDNVTETNDNLESKDYLYVNDGDHNKDDKSCDKKTNDVSVTNAKKCVRKRIRNENGSYRFRRKKIKLEPVQFTKERLKTELEAKFELWGELTTEDGTVIDKTVIMECLNDKITDERMRWLWKYIWCETPYPATIRILKQLMQNYKTEEQCSNVFDIEYLNTEDEMHQELLRRKTYECYLTAKYRCEICYLVFNKPKHLDNHIKMHQEDAGKFICNICSIRFPRKVTLRQHETSVHGAAYKCKLCPLVTYYRQTMVNHYNQHKGKFYPCKSCGKVFKSKSGYNGHKYVYHRRGRHVCTTCGRAFVSELGVALHKARMHQNETPPSEGASIVHCTECDLSFPSEEVLLKHKLTWHKKRKVVKKTMQAVLSLGGVKETQKHLAQKNKPSKKTSSTAGHTRRAPKHPKKRSVMTCRVCNAEGESMGWLQLHFMDEHPGVDMTSLYTDKHPHLCDICGRCFCATIDLRDHLNIHSGARPYACKVCGAKFHRAVSLRTHRLVHGPPSKQCTVCAKKFKSAANLYSHMRSHIGNRRYKCNICGKGFLHRSAVKAHIKGVHNKIKRVKKKVPITVTSGDANTVNK